MVDNMQELKEKRIWMLWRWETKPDGKRTKVPMSVSGGPCGTDKKWCSTWTTYDEAVAAKETVSGAAGIGFKIPEGYYFIDIVDRFLALVRKYTDVKELTAEIIREFVEKIYVYQSERIDGHKAQRIKIVWNCIGEFTPPVISDKEESA